MPSVNQNTSSLDRINSTLTPSSTMDPALDNFFSVLGVSICIVGFFGNVSVLVAFFTHRGLRTKINAFLVSLAFSDLLLTGISMPLEVEWHIRSEFIHGVIVCELIYTIHFLTLTSSSLNLFVISVYRYLTIAYPFYMKRVTSLQVILVAIVVVWIYSGITALLPLLGWRSLPTSTSDNYCYYSFDFDFALFVFITNFLLPAVLVFVFYGLIFRIARIHAIKILKSQVLSEYDRMCSPLLKGAKTLAKIAAVYLICWFPYVIDVIVAMSGVPVPYLMHYTFVFLCYASAAINPFLYAGLCKDFREVFRKWACKACNWLSSVFRGLAYPSRRIVTSLCADRRKRTQRNAEGHCPSFRTRTTSGSSSVYHQQTVATVV